MRIALVLLAGCYALPPPMILPPHAHAAPDPVGTTTGMLIVGGATDVVGHGVGVALRVARQDTDRTTFGVELSGARLARGVGGGKGGGVAEPARTLIGLRGFARYSESDHVATSGGLGFSILSTGLVTGTVDAGVLVSRPSPTFIPVGALDVAFALPLHNARFAGNSVTYYDVPASPSLSVGMDLGGIVPFDADNRLSLDAGWVLSIPMTEDSDGDAVLHASVAEIARFR